MDWFVRPKGDAVVLSFEKIHPVKDKNSVIDWLIAEPWPFHVNQILTSDKVQRLIEEGDLLGDEQMSFWIAYGPIQRVGLLTIFNLNEEDIPRLDLRIKSRFRNHGIGKRAVHWVTSYLFSLVPDLGKVEGTTRADNLAMSRAFEHAGFTKEGHLRNSWPVGRCRKDTLIFGLLREEWARGRSQPLVN